MYSTKFNSVVYMVLKTGHKVSLVLWAKDEKGAGLGHGHHCLLELQVGHGSGSGADWDLWFLFLIIT